jgi:hypothetical protein
VSIESIEERQPICVAGMLIKHETPLRYQQKSKPFSANAGTPANPSADMAKRTSYLAFGRSYVRYTCMYLQKRQLGRRRAQLLLLLLAAGGEKEAMHMDP